MDLPARDPFAVSPPPEPVHSAGRDEDPFSPLARLRSGSTHIVCDRCSLAIGEVGLHEGKPFAYSFYAGEHHDGGAGMRIEGDAVEEIFGVGAHMDGEPERRTYGWGQRMPLWCPRCRRRYDGHTPKSLVNRVRRQRPDVLTVPY